MPTHVHVLIQQHDGVRLADIIHSWKSFTANRINARRGTSGPFWARDYHDRFVRDDRHFGAAVAYIEENPVKAGLAAAPQDWPWSSARHR